MIAGLGRLEPCSVLREDPHVACAHAGYDLVLCELICGSRKHKLWRQPATNQPDGQIT
jgi:hypothetical protein